MSSCKDEMRRCKSGRKTPANTSGQTVDRSGFCASFAVARYRENGVVAGGRSVSETNRPVDIKGHFQEKIS